MPTAASTGSAPNRLILRHIPMVQSVASAVKRTLPEHVRLDELVSAGLAALVDCARRYEAHRGVSFAQFARTRIRGAMIDEVRSADWASRGVRSAQRRLNEAAGTLASRHGRTASSAELADAMGMTAAELHRLRRSIDRALAVSLESVTESGFDPRSSSATPEELIVRRERIGILRDAIAELPDNLRDVIDWFYYRNERMAAIGERLGVSESRASQMCHEALRTLRVGMDRQDIGSLGSPSPAGKKKSRKQHQIDAYAAAIAARSSLAQRLSVTSAMGEIVPADRDLAA